MPVIAGCAAHTAIEPVGEGRLRGNAGLGGPIVAAFGTHVPIPYLYVGGDYGLSDRLDLDGGLHLLSLAYGVAGLDLGATWYPLINDGPLPTLGVGGRMTLFASVKSGVDDRFRLLPSLTSSAAWEAGPGKVYAGFDLAIPLTRPAYDTAAAPLIFSPLAGYRWDLGSRSHLFVELKWQGANVRTDQLAAEYVHPGGHGAITPFVAYAWDFN